MTSAKQKVGIFTLTHALNYGAFYQMYAMTRFFEKSGYDVTVFDCQRTLKYKVLRLFSYNPDRQVRKIILHRKYKNDRAVIRIRPYENEKLDFAILGSDEIWNLENRSFEHSPEYVGLGISARSIIAYAPSIGYAAPENLIADEDFKKGLRRADGILARDQETRNVAERVTGRSISEVIDPTILFNSWDEMLSDRTKPDEDYILYYGYTGEPWFKDALIDFAKEKGLKIYTAGFRKHDWCDKNLLAGPREFLDLMQNAKYVFTNTFHGLVMAVLLDKSLCYSSPMQKIKDFSEKIGINADALTESSGRIEVEASLGRDRSERNQRIRELGAASQKLLLDMMDDAARKPAVNER